MKVGCRVDDCDKHEFDVNHLLFQNGKLYSAGDDGKIKAFSPDLKKVAEVQAHVCSVFWLAASKDSLYSCSNDGTVKEFELDTLKEKQTLITDTDAEFWRVAWAADTLYAGDNNGNIRVYKSGQFYGILNIAEPVKDMIIDSPFLFTSNLDIIVTEAKLEGEKIQYGNKKCIVGRGPLTISGDKFCFTSREGKDIVVHEKSQEKHWNEVTQQKGAHELIINALAGARWDDSNVLFSGGWDKNVKKWKLDGDKIVSDGSVNVDIIVNAIAIGEKNEIYVGGGDGHIVRVEV